MSYGGSSQGGYAPPGGNQMPVGSVYGRTPTQTPAWGGPGLRWGSTDTGTNSGYAAQAMPGTPGGYQQGFAATAGTPWSSNPNQYGRWNWLNQQPQQGQPPPQGQPYQPPPPQNPYQPPPQQYQPPPQQATPSPQVPSSGTGAMPTATNPYAGGAGNVNYSQAAIDRGMNVGDIWSNPAFANAVAGGWNFGA